MSISIKLIHLRLCLCLHLDLLVVKSNFNDLSNVFDQDEVENEVENEDEDENVVNAHCENNNSFIYLLSRRKRIIVFSNNE